MNIVNLTPHTLNIYDKTLHGEGNHELVATIEPSGTVARVTTTKVQIGNMASKLLSRSFPIWRTERGGATELPPMKDGTIYVVSGMYASANRREDVYQPGELLRGERGRVVGCVGLSK